MPAPTLPPQAHSPNPNGRLVQVDDLEHQRSLYVMAKRFHNLGANINVIGRGGKKPAHKWERWQSSRQTLQELKKLPWKGYKDVVIVGIGIVNGSGGIRFFDLDAHKGEAAVAIPEAMVDTVLLAMGLPKEYAWVYQSGSGKGWGIIFRCLEEVPADTLTPSNNESGVFWGVPLEPSPLHHLELRYSTGQTIVPPSEHESGNAYIWRWGEPTGTKIATVTMDAVLKGFHAIARPRRKTITAEKADTQNQSTADEDGVREEIRQKFDLVEYAKANFSQKTQEESNGEIRILGNGGLLIDPNKQIWNCFADGVNGQRLNGDCFDLVGWHRHGESWFNNRKRYWGEVIQDAANFVGVELTQYSHDEKDMTHSANEQMENANTTTAANVPQSLAELEQRYFEPINFLIENLLALGNLAMLGGRPKSGKSWWVLQLAKCVDSGEQFLGRDTQHGKVLYIALEDGERRLHERMKLLEWKPTAEAKFLTIIPNFDKSDGTPGPGVSKIAEFAQQYDLIVIDTLIKTLSGRANENDNTTMGAIINELARIAHDTDTAIVMVHHTGKNQTEDVFNTLRGASALRGGYDVGMVLVRRNDEREAMLHVESRDMDVEDMTLRQLENGAGWEYIGGGFELTQIRAGKETFKAMVEQDQDHEGLTAKDIAEIRGVKVTGIYKQLDRLVENGYIMKEENPSTVEGKIADRYFIADKYQGLSFS